MDIKGILENAPYKEFQKEPQESIDQYKYKVMNILENLDYYVYDNDELYESL